jgi:hypothetical protein
MECKAEPFVALIVDGIARLQIGGHAFDVDARQVLCEERHAEAVASVRRMRSEKTQVVVRLPMWVSVGETRHYCIEICGAAATQGGLRKLLERNALRRGQLILARRDPDRDRLARLGHPDPWKAQGALQPQAPEGSQAALIRVRERAAPHRVVCEGKLDGFSRGVQVGEGRDSSAHRSQRWLRPSRPAS